MKRVRQTHVPPFPLLTPKLLPTTPVHEQLLPRASVHRAVAVLPVRRHVIAEKTGEMVRERERRRGRVGMCILWKEG